MIIRCEVSLDCGKTWRLATIAREEEPTVYGTAWEPLLRLTVQG